MESNSNLIEPNSQYRQLLRLLMSESEISDLYHFLVDAKEQGLSLPEVAKILKSELWYMLIEVHEFNAYQAQGGKP